MIAIDSDTTELRLSLDQCRVMVMQNNLDLKVQWFNPKIAGETVTVARAVFEPLVFSSFNFYKSETPTISDLETSSSQSESWDLGLNIPLRTGGQITMNVLANVDKVYWRLYAARIQWQETADDSPEK